LISSPPTRRCRTATLTIRFQARGAIFAIVIFKPDLILIYRKPDAASLELVRIGSHSELGL
jgi:hypothetical protein